jgi:hypothetical protein
MSRSRQRRTLVWLEPEQTTFVRAVAQLAQLEVVLAGSSIKGRSDHVASELNCAALHDVRAGLANADVDLVWFASSGNFGASNLASDARAVLLASDRGVRIASSSPLPSSVDELAAHPWLDPNAPPQSPLAKVHWIGTLRRSAAMQLHAEQLRESGPARCLAVHATCSPQQDTLPGRLLSAWDAVLQLIGLPETVDTVYTSPQRSGSLHALPGKSLDHLRGDLASIARFADGRSATVLASDQSDRWAWRVESLAGDGMVRIESDAATDAGERECARELAGVLDQTLPPLAPIAIADLLAIAQACLLSARTGQPESPESFLRLMH